MLKKTGNVNHKKGAGRPRKITAPQAKAIGQFVRRDPTISTRLLVTKLSNEVSHCTIARHLKGLSYEKDVPMGTPMLTACHKEKRVEWAKKHLNDDWNNTVFTDETAFQLFYNTVERWYKGARPIRPIPKDRTKILAWGGFSIRGKVNLFCFKNIMDAKFYVEILENNIPQINRLMRVDGGFNRTMTQNTQAALPKHFFRKMLLK